MKTGRSLVSETELQMAALGLEKPDLNLSQDRPEESDKSYGELFDKAASIPAKFN